MRTHRRHFVAKPDKSGTLPLVRVGNMPNNAWPLTIMAEVAAGPADSVGREVHVVIDNLLDLDVLEYGIVQQRKRLALFGDTGRVQPDGSRS